MKKMKPFFGIMGFSLVTLVLLMMLVGAYRGMAAIMNDALPEAVDFIMLFAVCLIGGTVGYFWMSDEDDDV